jgi:hypothetical protein
MNNWFKKMIRFESPLAINDRVSKLALKRRIASCYTYI